VASANAILHSGAPGPGRSWLGGFKRPEGPGAWCCAYRTSSEFTLQPTLLVQICACAKHIAPRWSLQRHQVTLCLLMEVTETSDPCPAAATKVHRPLGSILAQPRPPSPAAPKVTTQLYQEPGRPEEGLCDTGMLTPHQLSEKQETNSWSTSHSFFFQRKSPQNASCYHSMSQMSPASSLGAQMHSWGPGQ
jgi:hypothetical protein